MRASVCVCANINVNVVLGNLHSNNFIQWWWWSRASVRLRLIKIRGKKKQKAAIGEISWIWIWVQFFFFLFSFSQIRFGTQIWFGATAKPLCTASSMLLSSDSISLLLFISISIGIWCSTAVISNFFGCLSLSLGPLRLVYSILCNRLGCFDQKTIFFQFFVFFFSFYLIKCGLGFAPGEKFIEFLLH